MKEAIAAPMPEAITLDDSEAFNQSFDDGKGAEQVQGEVASLAMDPIQRDKLLKLADKYAENISTVVLPTLRKLHTDITTGVFKSIAPDVKGISGINEDLAALAEALRGRVRDAVIKSDKDGNK